MPTPLIEISVEDKQKIISFIDAAMAYDMLATRIEALNVDRDTPTDEEMLQMTRRQEDTSIAADRAQSILERSFEQAEKEAIWEDAIPMIRERIALSPINSRMAERFFTFVKESGGARALCERGLREVREIDSNLSLRTSNIRKGSSNNAMSNLACGVVAVAGILGTIGLCLGCGVGAIGATAIGGCF